MEDPVRLNDIELLYLRGLVSDDIESFNKRTVEQSEQRSRFTTEGLNTLYEKLDNEVAKRELDT